MKKILGLDLGTNSIGWALVGENEEKKEILGIGTRIIPMSQEVLGNFDKGISKSQTKERTGFRGVRRLRERHLLRRERLHRILNILGFLPDHYAQSIDFDNRLGKFVGETEPKLVWKEIAPNKYDFIFKSSFDEMVKEFKASKSELFTLNEKGEERKIPYDWTIYYLRKKALRAKIEEAELAWLLLNFNQKRGCYQLRGEDEEDAKLISKTRKYFERQLVSEIFDTGDVYKGLRVLIVKLANGNSGKIFKKEIPNWIGTEKNIIATIDLDKNGNDKVDENGLLSQRFSIPTDAEWETEWKLIKLKTEKDIEDSNKTVGSYIYDTLLKNPAQKINGRLVRTIERKYYKQELKSILDKQKEFHQKLQDPELYNACLEELYKNNESHRRSIVTKDFTHLFLNDVIFYQRPLKSKKSLISNCKYEYRSFKDQQTGEIKKEPVKCISKSHPLYQEFRLWKFVRDFKIIERERHIDGKLKTDIDVTSEFFKTEEDFVALFNWLNDRKEIKQDTLLSSYFKIRKKKGEEKSTYRWNYVEDKDYPCNETHSQILTRFSKVNNIPENFLNNETELAIWHMLYSVEDKLEIEKALKSFAAKNNLDDDFVEVFKKFPPFKKEYGSYSAKAIKKLLPLMRMGKYWNEDNIDVNTKQRINKILSGEFDENIRIRVREKAIKLTELTHFKGLPEWLVCYIVYDRHSESGELKKWNSPEDIEYYLKEEFRQHSFHNPIVEQVITETLRTVKDIWKKYGNFSEIHIELGREMKNPADKRKEMTLKISENENTNLRIKALLAELADHNDVENVRPYSPSQQEILKIYEEGVLYSGIEIPDDIAKIAKASRPSKSDLLRYKLWLEQKYRSPYTGEMIPLGKLFTSDYEIEHIIPQSRYFDDSLSNKVICESAVNKEKENSLGYEFIKKNEGRIIELNFGETVKIFTIPEYESFVKEHYGKSQSRGKMKKLLMEEIPESFIERQLNDSRYISKVVKSLLSNIVREDAEQEEISKNVIPGNGSITNTLKNEWGLNDVWNKIITPRFLRMNELTKSNQFGKWTNKEGKNVFQTDMPLELQKGFTKKRIDHRHHALDALVIACATRSHINYLNNESAKSSAKESRYDLKNKLCFKTKVDNQGNYQWQFYKPWETFTEDAQNALENIVVSFKQNLRVINKTVNKYQSCKNGKRTIEIQNKGDNWAIRKPLHKDTIAGIVNLRLKKEVTLSASIDQWELLVDKNLKTKIKQLINEGFDKKKIQKFFAKEGNKWMGKELSKVELYYFTNDKENEVLVASRVNIDDSFNSKKIESITDTGIQQILLKHLGKYKEEKDEKTVEHPELAFSPEGIDEMNNNITSLNNGRFHQPIYKVRTYELKGNKFNVGSRGSKKDKYVVAATGTNLYFAIYMDKNGKRSFETIQLIDVIERLKNNDSPVHQFKVIDENIDLSLKFYLNPNDLVYVPNPDQIENNNTNINEIDRTRIYRFIDSSDTIANFVPVSAASTIFKMNKKEQENIGLNFPIQNEFGVGSPQSKNQKAVTGEIIKDVCLKLKIDRLGNISF